MAIGGRKEKKGKLRFVYKGAAESGKGRERKFSFWFLLVQKREGFCLLVLASFG